LLGERGPTLTITLVRGEDWWRGTSKPQGGYRPTEVWEFCEVRVNASQMALRTRSGERLLDSFCWTPEYTGERGKLSVTNLRLVWMSSKDKRSNVSIGFDCVQSLTGTSDRLHVRTEFKGTGHEFVFAGCGNNASTRIQAVLNFHEKTMLYRYVVLRKLIIGANTELLTLPNEKVYEKIHACNLGPGGTSSGVLILTNVRVVWFSSEMNRFNVSIPHIQTRLCALRNCSFGLALVLETWASSGAYKFGFKTDPEAAVTEAWTHIFNVWKLYTTMPIFGLDLPAESERDHAIGTTKAYGLREDQQS